MVTAGKTNAITGPTRQLTAANAPEVSRAA